jgi:tyrosine-protein kinase Etk/Wzc
MSLNADPQAIQYRARRAQPLPDPEAFQLGEWLADLWDGRYTILVTTALVTATGGFLVWRAPPIYQADGLLELRAKTPPADPSLAKVQGLFSEPGDAQTELEILKSDLILGRAARSLGMELSARPRLLPVIGEALARRQADPPRIQIDQLEVPARRFGQTFHVTALPGGSIRWSSPAGAPLATGRPREVLTGVLDGAICTLRVQAISARPGQDFLVAHQTLTAAVASLRQGFDAAERGTLTNVIGLSYRGASPAQCAAVLNAIVSQYAQYKLERKTGDANQTRAMLEARLGPLKAALDASESRLNQYRSRYGSVDLSREAENLLLQSSSYTTQISALELKRQDALRTFNERSDVVATLDKQIQALKDEAARLGGKVRDLPGTQQEVVRLSREVALNSDLYTALQNDIQQLGIAGSGEVGNLAVVDPATVDPDPVGPKASVLVSFYLAFGAVAGAALAMLRQLLHRGIKDHRLIESRLRLPVLVTIPHSRDQEHHARAVLGGRKGAHLLAADHPDDLAVESLRTLRTTLLFTLKAPKSRAVMITGPAPDIGKSFLCANLATMLAQTGARVLLVDADLRRGDLHRYFGLKTRLGGLSEVLSGRSEWSRTVQPTEIPNLALMSTGIIPADSAQLLLAPRFQAFAAEAAAAYDYVLYDAPPLLPVTDATIIGASVGTVLLVAKFGRHSLDELRTCQQRLEDHELPLNGVVFNDIAPTGLGYGYQTYRYAYHYKYK